MAKRKRRAAARRTKAKLAKGRTRASKRPVKRAIGKKSSKSAKKVATKTSRKRASRTRRVTPSRQEPTPAVETAVIDVVDEPIPGVVRVTEIEETRVTLPDPDAQASRDIPEPDSLGG